MQTCPSCGEQVPNEYILCVWCGMDLTAEKIRRSGITIGNREAIDRMQRVVLDPLNAFREISLLPDLRGGKLIFYAIGVMMTFNMITIFSKLDGMVFNEDGLEYQLTANFAVPVKLILNLVFLIIQPLVLLLVFMGIWKISARILGLLSRSFGGKGDKEKIRATVGYSMLPVFFGWTLAWLIRLVTPSETVSSINYGDVQTAVVAVTEQGFGIVGLIFIYIGWIWTVGLGIIAIKESCKLSWVEAVIVGGIPYILFASIVL